MNTETDMSKKIGEDLLAEYTRAVELDAKPFGNGQSPFKKEDLKKELGRRLEYFDLQNDIKPSGLSTGQLEMKL